MKRFFQILVIVLIYSSQTWAQDEKVPVFTADSASFIEQVWDYFDNFQGRDKPAKTEIRKITNNFAEIWNLPSFNQEYKERTVAVLNRMEGTQMRPIPHFSGYLQAVESFFRAELGMENFIEWNASLDKYLTTRQMRQYDEVLQKWILIFDQGVLYDTRGLQWVASGKYTILSSPVPSLHFAETDLRGYANRDSTCIWKTSGDFNFESLQWTGHSGKITWERAGFSPDSVYALLPNYSLVFNTVSYTIDSVNFIHKDLFGNTRLPGRLDEKVLADATPDKAIYPQFISYDVRIPIKNIFKNIDYDGGFTMEGSKIIGSGDGDMDAVLTIHKDGNPFMTVRSKRYSIRNDRLFAKSAYVVFLHDRDSVYHPNVSLSYLDKERTLTLTRGRDGTSQSPFFDSFHEMDMFYGVLSWNLDEDLMELQAAKSLSKEGNAGFESWNYFTENRFYEMQVLDELNPIVVIKDFTHKIGSNEFYLYELTEYWRRPQAQVKAVLMNLANYGFLEYNLDQDRVYVKDRLFEFLEAKNKKRDYDVIAIQSNIKNVNHGELDLNTFDQTIRGIPYVFLSDSQNVMIYPANTEIILKKGRDFSFSGLIKAGLLDFYASDCSFEYDTFRLNMPQIDSLTFMIRTGENDSYGNPILQKVQTAIQNLNGYLNIDMPFNKSGLEDFPQYPIFTNLDKAFVYYDNKAIHGGIYDRDEFYYTVDPFTFDSLNTFVPDKLEFTGKLNSAGIFPDINQPLKVESDYSLGFHTPVPDTGYPVYGGKGRFYKELELSNAGMHGDGSLDYLTSNIVSTDFLFYPDSMSTTIDTMMIAKQLGEVEYPNVAISKSQILWLPYSDEMYISNEKDHPFDMYDGLLSFDGTLTYSPNYLLGDGSSEFTYATMKSNKFRFYEHRFITDTTTLELATLDYSGLALSTYVYSSTVDFSTKMGQFRTHGKGSVVDFPVNKYACFMDEFDWNMEKNQVDLRNNIAMRTTGLDTLNYKEIMDMDFSGSEFVSTHPDQNSLKFFCLEATYDLEENVISAKDVKLIRVGDGAVFPGNGLVTIFKDAELSPLSNALIITDSLHKYHTIYDAEVNIAGKNRIRGTGSYDYIDDFGDVHKIDFTSLSVNANKHITAKAEIPQNRPFPVSPTVDFSGDITLEGNEKFLNFDGGFRLRQDCYEDDTWVMVNKRINPDNVSIPSHDSLVDIKKARVYTALAFETVANKIYPAFFSRLRKSTDFFILKATGDMTYDNIAEEYRIRDTVRYKDFPANGTYLNLNVRKCIVEGQGLINFGVDFSRVILSTYGKVSHYIIPDSTSFEVLAGMDFFFNSDALTELGRDLSEAELPGASLNRKDLLNSLALLLDEKSYERVKSDIDLYGNIRRFPDALDFPVLFSDLNMSWNEYSRSFVSSGPMGIAKVGKRQVNKYVEGYVEFSRKRTGDVFNIFLKIDASTWYFFSYTDGILQAISSNQKFNDFIINTKGKHRKLKREGNLQPYQYIISTPNKMSAFVEKMYILSEN